MSLHDAPDAADLVSVVAELLADQVMPALDGELRWQVRIATNVLTIVARELRQDPGAASDHREGLRSTGFTDERSLCTAIRDGTLAQDDPRLRAWVTATVEAKLRVARPTALGDNRPNR